VPGPTVLDHPDQAVLLDDELACLIAARRGDVDRVPERTDVNQPQTGGGGVRGVRARLERVNGGRRRGKRGTHDDRRKRG
jgi:hypothetical protein